MITQASLNKLRTSIETQTLEEGSLKLKLDRQSEHPGIQFIRYDFAGDMFDGQPFEINEQIPIIHDNVNVPLLAHFIGERIRHAKRTYAFSLKRAG